MIVDIQNDYFPGGANPLDGPEAAAANAAAAAAIPCRGRPVVHLKHVWDAPDATFMRPGTPGVEIHDSVTPGAAAVLSKAAPNGFVGTSLEADLRAPARRRSWSAG